MEIAQFLQHPKLARSVRQTGDNQWEAICPAHDDTDPSLGISEGDDGRILLFCQGGCETEDVVESLELKMSDLQPVNGNGHASNGKGQKLNIIEAYDYRDESGKLLFQACRCEPKDFRQRAPNGNGGWVWKTKGIRKVPYRLPDLLAFDQGEWVLVLEGEKDCNRCWDDLGLPATCNAMGAGKWKAEHGKPLAGRHVAIVPDNDNEGRKHAQQVARHLHGLAASVRVVELPGLKPKGDLSDWVDAGGTTLELLGLIDQAEEWKAADAAEEGEPVQEQQRTFGQSGTHALTDMGNAKRFLFQHGRNLRYCL